MSDMPETIIYHIDVNSAFLSWEAVYRLKFLGASLDLRTVPSAVGGDVEQRHGIILAKSIPAKAYHIKTGESVPEARQKCQNLILVPPNYGLYERCSKAFMNLIREYTPDVEQYSIDEAFMNMTEERALYPDPVRTAEEIRVRIREELGFTVNIGVSSNKLLAKMASDFEKPDRVHTLFPDEIEGKMWKLPVSELFFVGRATSAKLFRLGIYTIGQLAASDPMILEAHLKSYGRLIWNFANGRDLSAVVAEAPLQKGYGNSTTIAFDVTDEPTARVVLLALAETVGARLRRDAAMIRVVNVGIRFSDLSYVSSQGTLNEPTDITWEIYEAAAGIFHRLWNGRPIRHLGIHTSRVCRDGGRQARLFDTRDYVRLSEWERTVDGIRARFGPDSVKRAVFLASPGIDHLSGGISREKRTVDYSKQTIR